MNENVKLVHKVVKVKLVYRNVIHLILLHKFIKNKHDKTLRMAHAESSLCCK
jgi:hypothetical protein